MNELRKQIETMRKAYRSARYAGDLAAEMLPPPGRQRVQRPVLMPLAFGSLVTGLAAAVVLWMGIRPPAATAPLAPSVPAAVANQPSDVGEVVLPGIDFFLSFPDDLPLVPPGGPVEIGSMPSMPSLDFGFSDTEFPREST